MSVNKYAGASMDDMVFEGRNKQYGAYELRRINPKFMAISTAIAVAAYVAFILLSQLNITLGSKEEKQEVIVESTEVDLPKDELKLPDAPPPPPPPPPPPQAPQIKFVEMVVKKDELVAEEKVATQEELKDDNKLISNQNKEGEGVGRTEIKTEQPTGKGPNIIVEKEDVPDDKAEFTIVEKMPEFPGGAAEMKKYLNKVTYPEIAVENGIEGTVVVSFLVEKDGSISDVKVLKGADLPGGLADAAVKHVLKMPKWTPGKQRDMPVRVRMNAPIKFKLQ